MNFVLVKNVIKEAMRFVDKAEQAANWLEENDPMGVGLGSKETAACHRASMDLTRALADLRRRPGREKGRDKNGSI